MAYVRFYFSDNLGRKDSYTSLEERPPDRESTSISFTLSRAPAMIGSVIEWIWLYQSTSPRSSMKSPRQANAWGR